METDLATTSHGCLPSAAAKLGMVMLWPEILQELAQRVAVALQRDMEIHITSSTEAAALGLPWGRRFTASALVPKLFMEVDAQLPPGVSFSAVVRNIPERVRDTSP